MLHAIASHPGTPRGDATCSAHGTQHAQGTSMQQQHTKDATQVCDRSQHWTAAERKAQNCRRGATQDTQDPTRRYDKAPATDTVRDAESQLQLRQRCCVNHLLRMRLRQRVVNECCHPEASPHPWSSPSCPVSAPDLSVDYQTFHHHPEDTWRHLSFEDISQCLKMRGARNPGLAQNPMASHSLHVRTLPCASFEHRAMGEPTPRR